jgi:phage-related protein/predicted XRE-type DNA-binding protein
MRCTSHSKAASTGDTKTLTGFGGAGLVEVVKDYRGDTFRAVYTLRYQGAVYVLHAFQKKSKTGRETPRQDIELIKQRLREADSERGKAMSKRSYEIGGRNVFKDIGVPNADEHLVKAQLVFKIDTIMKKRRMKQTEAATLFEVRQPDISKMLRGEFRQFSVERLMRFLVKLNQDVEIVVRPHRGRENAPALHVS